MQPARQPSAPAPTALDRALAPIHAGQLEDDPAALRRIAREARQAILHPDFERVMLDRQRPAANRLGDLTVLQRELRVTQFAARDRAEIADEIDRFGMRILNAERIVVQIVESSLPTAERAAALLTLVYRGLSPGEACTKMIMDQTRTLLETKEGRAMLAASDALRNQIQGLLASMQD